MSFNVSIGDGVAVAKLALSITKCLQDVGGARSEYQELLRELETLQKALAHLDTLQAQSEDPSTLNSIKFATISCRQPLEDFLRRIRKYDDKLGVASKRGRLKGVKRKVQWTITEKDAIDKLQKYLNRHVSTINVMLTEYGLESMSIANKKAATDRLHLRERIEHTHQVMDSVRDDAQSQFQIVRHTNTLVSRLFRMVSGDIKSSWQLLHDMVAKVCVSTQQIYEILVEIKASVATINTCWTFFQAPYLVEDALGFKFPVPSEYDFELLNNVLKWRLRDRDFYPEVEAGNYELSKSNRSDAIITKDTLLTPGTSITMAMVVLGIMSSHEDCPLQCGSSRTIVVPSGGRKCTQCGVWFDAATKPREPLVDARMQLAMDEAIKSNQGGVVKTRRTYRATKSPHDQEYKHVRSYHWGMSSAHEDTSLSHSLGFMHRIKEAYSDRPETHHELLDIMRDFGVGAIDAPGVVHQMSALIIGQPDLIEGFDTFLPPGYTVRVVNDGSGRSLRCTTPETVSYICCE